MPILDENSGITDLVIDVSSTCLYDNVWMEEYLCQSVQRLESIAEIVQRGDEIDSSSHDWMLAQVDFIVETLGGETGELNESLRSSLLQLILTIANLNQQIRGNFQVPAEQS